MGGREEFADGRGGVVGIEVGRVYGSRLRRGGVMAREFSWSLCGSGGLVGELALLRTRSWLWLWLRQGRRGVLGGRFAREDVAQFGVFFVFRCCGSRSLAVCHAIVNIDGKIFCTNGGVLLDIVASGFAPFIGGSEGLLPFLQI